MTTRRRLLYLSVPVLLAAAGMPLHAQFAAHGCPGGPLGQFLGGFTAGTLSSSQLCLTGSFSVGATYTVQLSSPLTTFSINGIQPASTTSFAFIVPSSFYATVSHPGQSDPVSIAINGPGASLNQNGSFQINPPLQAGGPVFVSPVNTSVAWTMYSGGTPPYQNEFSTGQVPPGMFNFPSSSPAWPGIPSQTGVFQFIMIATDAWGNEISPNLAAYIVPTPQVTSLNPTSTVAGAGITTVTINGSGFVSPTTIGSTPEPGSSVLITPSAPSAVSLTPASFSANQLTVNIPANLLATTGFLGVQVVNPSPVSSNSTAFTVNPSITGLSTIRRTANTSAFALGVTGTGFLNGSAVRMNGQPLPTTFVNTTNLTATFPTVATPGAETLTVLNPDYTVSPITSAGVLNVVAAPTLTSLYPTSVNAGGSTFPLTVTGANYASGMTVFFNSNPEPTSFSSTNQLIATIPAAAIASGATVPVWVATTDGFVTPAQFFTIVSTTPPLQLLNLSPLPAGMVGTPYSVTFTSTGGVGADTFASIGGTLPAGLNLSSAGVLSGTPTAVGASKFTIQVTDSTGTTVSRDYSLNIAPAPLSLTTGPLSNTLQNVPISIQFTGSGGVPPYTFVEFGALPPGTQFTSAGLLSGTPTKAGTYPFLVFIDDSTGASASQKYSLTVGLPGLLITPPSPLPSGQVAVPYTTQLAATGGRGTPYTWSATGLPAGLTIANNTGLIAGIPQTIGSFTVAVTVGDSSGATVTQNYTLVIASGRLTITTASLSNGAVGSSYTAGLAASGGSGTVTFAAAGLPPGVTLTPSGTLSGTPTAAGSFTVNVTATDAQGLTATAAFPVTIASKLVVTGVTISNATVGTGIPVTKLTATGGTPPYQWQSPNPAPGLSLATDGTLQGIPTAPGIYSFTVFAVDNNGALSSGTVQVTVGLPGAPSVTITGLPATNAPATQPSVQIALANPYVATVTAKLTLTFAPDSGPDDPSVQFVTGGRTAQIVVPAGSTGGLTAVGLQTGTVAGTITITVQLLAGALDVTPTPAPSRSVRVSPGAPVITSITATRTSTGFTVVVAGYSSTRDVASGAYQFSASAGANLLTTQVATPVGTLFTQWYGSSTSAPFGSQFSLTQPFTVTGNTSTVLSVTVTLTNSVGTSPAVTANLQ